MIRALIFTLLMICACDPNTISGNDARRILINPSRLEFYLYESNEENECLKYLQNPDLRTQKKPDLVRQSWADFESHGFATIQIDHLVSAKKMLIFVTATDPGTNEIVAQGCIQDVEIEKGALREIELVLHKVSHLEPMQ